MTTELLCQYVGFRVRTLREERGWTQEQLAQMVGLTRTSVTNIERGNQRITLPNLYQFGLAFGVPVQDLLPPIIVNDYGYMLRNDVRLKSLGGISPRRYSKSHKSTAGILDRIRGWFASH